MTKLVIGLGNPGLRYQHTRHNMGFLVVRELQRRSRVRESRQGPARVALANVAGEVVVLARPTTFMNQSGRAVAYLLRRHRMVDLASLLIIVDDMDLPVATLRLRPAGSDAGHNGLRSIIEAVGSQEFARLRVGIGRPPPGEDPVDYVLARFEPEERQIVGEAVARAVAATESWLERGLVETMSRFNRPPGPEEEER